MHVFYATRKPSMLASIETRIGIVSYVKSISSRTNNWLRAAAHARREKSIRHGHISTLHIRWARRPLPVLVRPRLLIFFPTPDDSASEFPASLFGAMVGDEIVIQRLKLRRRKLVVKFLDRRA